MVAPIIPVPAMPALTDIKQKCRNIATAAARAGQVYRDIFVG